MSTRARMLAGAFLGLLVAALVIVQVWTLASVADQTRINGATSQRVLDCTKVGGRCFAESQDRTKAAIVGINEGTLRVIVAALTCEDRGLTGERLARCTTRLADSD